MAGRMVLCGTAPPSGPKRENTPDAPIFPCWTSGCEQAKAAGALVRQLHPYDLRPGADQPPGSGRRDLQAGRLRGESDPDLLEWDYGAYEGLTTAEIRQLRPGWTLWDDGVPEGETLADVGRRADRVIERARASETDTLCVAHGHILRVRLPGGSGCPPSPGRLFLLGTGAVCMLGWDLEWPALQAWNVRG